ncbi:17819_t:CDS:2 [Funneliformis geosporum]|uniref:5691_t:CDS:1 n=1 Tax=Funneliformis geosporum TaxID=1117311 RepID=A0A9W4SMR4_9GLOM|nr:17819_t:CDS:2 [Funneliformis geosporum]CAI2174769.1 5691_t:CDS:2 [Funneliformis geosporum]
METNVYNPIPVEFYNEIFSNFKRDIKTLHSCLFVNRFFSRLAIPLLWSTPFEHIDLDNPKAPLIISTYISSLVDEDKSYLNVSGIPVGSPATPFFPYPEYLTSFNSRAFQILVDKWLQLIDPLNYSTNYKYKLEYAKYIISNLLFGSTTMLKSLRYFRLNSNDEMVFIKHKEFAYSISNLVNFEIDYYYVEGSNSYNQKEEKKLHDLFDNLSYYTSSIRYITINISTPYDVPFTKRVINSIVNFVTHQFSLKALSFNESLISANLSEFEEIINSQATTLKYLKIGGKMKNLARILRVLRNCVNLELLEFIAEEVIIGDDMHVDAWNYIGDFGRRIDEEIAKGGDLSVIREFEFNQLKIKSIYCIEDCVVIDNIVALGLEKTLMMTNINLRTLNLGKINSSIITSLGKYCYNLTHLSCELLLDDFYLFIKLLEVLRELKHLKMKLKLSSFINDNYIVAFANSLSNSLSKLGLDIYYERNNVFGLNIYNDHNERNNEFISYFLRVLLENLECNNLMELDFYNNQLIRDDNLKLVLQFALNRNEGSGDDGKFKLFRYFRKNFDVDFDQMLLQQGKEIIQIEYGEISDFYRPFHEPLYYYE